MRLMVFDWESTGKDPKKCRGVQFACLPVSLDGGDLNFDPFVILCDPQEKISDEAAKVHGISQEMVTGKIPDYEVAADFSRRCREGPTILCGHNIESYDCTLTDQLCEKAGVQGVSDLPILDTLQLAIRLWPTAPTHKLSATEPGRQGLIQHLKLPEGKAHDAMGDCIMVLELLGAALTKIKQEQLCRSDHVMEVVEWLREPVRLQTCHMGAHKGKPWSRVPKQYASWMMSWDSMNRDLQKTLQDNFQLTWRGK